VWYPWLLVKSTEGIMMALLGEDRSREVPKLFLLEERARWLLFFSLLLYHNFSRFSKNVKRN